MRHSTVRTAIATLMLSAPALALAAGPTHHKAAAKKSTRASAAAMDSARATQIQQALIQHGYLSGEPSGKWDAETIAAMQKLQGDNGWQTKITPDSRALIKLGLGPTPPTAQTEAATQPQSQTQQAQ